MRPTASCDNTSPGEVASGSHWDSVFEKSYTFFKLVVQLSESHCFHEALVSSLTSLSLSATAARALLTSAAAVSVSAAEPTTPCCDSAAATVSVMPFQMWHVRSSQESRAVPMLRSRWTRRSTSGHDEAY